MEPAIAPSIEIQAAGRIHRLGQSKPVAVTRYAFKDSYESCVVELHERIRAGTEQGLVDGQLSAGVVKQLTAK